MNRQREIKTERLKKNRQKDTKKRQIGNKKNGYLEQSGMTKKMKELNFDMKEQENIQKMYIY